MAESKAHDAIAPADDHLGRYPSTDGPESDNAMAKIIQKARAATEKERKMGMWKGMKIYPKAVAWSILISTCIAMEGYDISLVNNFYAFPQFNRKYGELQGDGSYQVPARVGHAYISCSVLFCSLRLSIDLLRRRRGGRWAHHGNTHGDELQC